jgi:hypothetical protein
VDADGSIQAETAAGLPGEHVGDGVVVEEATTLEVEQDAALQGALKAVDIVGAEVRRLVEDDGAVVAPGEDAVEHDQMVGSTRQSFLSRCPMQSLSCGRDTFCRPRVSLRMIQSQVPDRQCSSVCNCVSVRQAED